MYDFTLVLLLAFLGLVYILSSLAALVAWLIFGPEVAKWVGWICLGVGVLWVVYCYRESK